VAGDAGAVVAAYAPPVSEIAANRTLRRFILISIGPVVCGPHEINVVTRVELTKKDRARRPGQAGIKFVPLAIFRR
jgi:hypothetical protein